MGATSAEWACMQQPIGSWDDAGYLKLLGEIKPESLSSWGTHTARSPAYPITHHPPVLDATLILAAFEWHAKVVRQPSGSFNDCLTVLALPRGKVEFPHGSRILSHRTRDRENPSAEAQALADPECIRARDAFV